MTVVSRASVTNFSILDWIGSFSHQPVQLNRLLILKRILFRECIPLTFYWSEYFIHYWIKWLCLISSVPINGGWSPWSSYTSCTRSCGTGNKSRYRTCNSPLPSNGGSACTGLSKETVHCHTQACPCSGSHCPGYYLYCIYTYMNTYDKF